MLGMWLAGLLCRHPTGGLGVPVCSAQTLGKAGDFMKHSWNDRIRLCDLLGIMVHASLDACIRLHCPTKALKIG